jgi:hypothetical protein
LDGETGMAVIGELHGDRLRRPELLQGRDAASAFGRTCPVRAAVSVNAR